VGGGIRRPACDCLPHDVHAQVIEEMPAEIEVRDDCLLQLTGLMCLYGRGSHCWFTCQAAAAADRQANGAWVLHDDASTNQQWAGMSFVDVQRKCNGVFRTREKRLGTFKPFLFVFAGAGHAAAAAMPPQASRPPPGASGEAPTSPLGVSTGPAPAARPRDRKPREVLADLNAGMAGGSDVEWKSEMHGEGGQGEEGEGGGNGEGRGARRAVLGRKGRPRAQQGIAPVEASGTIRGQELGEEKGENGGGGGAEGRREEEEKSQVARVGQDGWSRVDEDARRMEEGEEEEEEEEGEVVVEGEEEGEEERLATTERWRERLSRLDEDARSSAAGDVAVTEMLEAMSKMQVRQNGLIPTK